MFLGFILGGFGWVCESSLEGGFLEGREVIRGVRGKEGFNK